jgi:hypothetical protein
VNTHKTEAACCTPEDKAWCLRWMQEHGTPDEWDQGAEDEYKKAHDKFLAGVAA